MPVVLGKKGGFPKLGVPLKWMYKGNIGLYRGHIRMSRALEGQHNKDTRTSGSILGFPCFGKLPYLLQILVIRTSEVRTVLA